MAYDSDVIRLLFLFPFLLEVALAIVIVRRRLYREVPWFAILIFYKLFATVLRFYVYDIDDRVGYFYIFWVLEGGMVTIECMVVIEVFRKCLLGFEATKAAARVLLMVTGVALSVVALLSVPYGSEHSVFLGKVVNVAERSVRFVQLGVVLVFFIFSKFLALSWRNYLFGIMLGFGLYSCGELATSAFGAEMGGVVAYKLMFVVSVIGNATMAIWLSYLLRADPKRSVPLLGRAEDLERWDEALSEIVLRKPKTHA
jgi:hypothetical protein